MLEELAISLAETVTHGRFLTENSLHQVQQRILSQITKLMALVVGIQGTIRQGIER
jgi:hypothetical protein